MKRATRWLLLGIAVLGCPVLGQTPPTSQSIAAPAILCPVTGQPIDRASATRFRGQWVYFASEAAREKFAADPYEYVEGVQRQWQADRPLRVQVRCPVTGQPVDPEVYVGQGQAAIYFANPAAKEKWQHDAQPYQAQLNKCYSFQTGCALCNMPAWPGVTRTFEGQELRFCCEGCAEGYAREPAARLAEVNARSRANEAAWKARQAESAAKTPTSATSPADPKR